MSPNANDHLLPNEATDISTVQALTNLDAGVFASLVPSLLFWTMEYEPNSSVSPPFSVAARSLLRSRASDPPIVAAISTAITLPMGTRDQVRIVQGAIWHVLMKLSVEELVPYLDALSALASSDTPDISKNGADEEDNECGRHSPKHQRPRLIRDAKDVLRFVRNPDEAWVPEHKFDGMAYRSMQERVMTAEQMRPLVPGLLCWIADGNNPPFSPCRNQLARFPEVTIEPIYEVLSSERDGQWAWNILSFVEDHVPIGPMWERLRPEVQRFMDDPTEDEKDSELPDFAAKWTKKLDAWNDQQVGTTKT